MSTYTALKKRQYLRKDVTTTPKKTSTPSSMVLYKVPRGRSLTNPRMADPGPELKNKDFQGSIGVIAGTSWSEVDLLNPIATGTTASDRIGRNVQLKSLLFRWNAASGNSTQIQALRILIVYDREPNGAIPLISDIVASSSIGFNTPLNLANGNRFVILADELHNPILSYNGASSNRVGKIFKKLNLPMKFTGQSSEDITTITQGAIFAMVSIPVVGNGGEGIGYNSRIRYTDV